MVKIVAVRMVIIQVTIILIIYTIILLMDSVCGAYLWSLQTEFWADRFATCLKLSPLTYFLYCYVLAL